MAWLLQGDGPRRCVPITSRSISWERRQSAERKDTAMPSYEYECTKCGRKFEAMQTFEEHDRHEDHDRHQLLKCPHCGSTKVEQRVASVFVITAKKS